MTQHNSISRRGSISEIGTSQKLEVGDRVRMSNLGRTRHSRYGDRKAVIVANMLGSSCRVRFDGSRTCVTIHRTYLEKID